MPTVPTFTDLPAVQDQRPEIAPQKDISGFQIRRLEAAGEGAEQLGQGIDKAAGDVSRIGDRMMARRPVDVEAATEFVVRLILGGLPSLPRVEP